MSKIEGLPQMPVENPNLERFQQVNSKNPQKLEEIKKLSQDFEAIFTDIVLKSMRDSVDKSNFIDGGNGEQIFQSMLDSEYSKSLSSQGMTGLAKSIEDHLTSLMGGAKTNMLKAEGRSQYGKQGADTK